MRDPEETKTALQEGIFGAIEKATDGALDYETDIWFQAEALIDKIMDTLFCNGDEEENDIEELCDNIDQFAEE